MFAPLITIKHWSHEHHHRHLEYFSDGLSNVLHSRLFLIGLAFAAGILFMLLLAIFSSKGEQSMWPWWQQQTPYGIFP